MPEIVCETLRDRHIQATAALLAAAFADNPCYAWMHPRAATRDRDLVAFFTRNLSWRSGLGLSWVACRAGEPVGTLSLEPPGGVNRPLADGVRHWFVPTARDQGLLCMARILQAESMFRRAYRELVGEDRYVHVHAVAVRPDLQGRGVGAALLAASRATLFELAARERVPVVLSTQRAQNLPFYARAGFSCWGERVLGAGRGRRGFTNWFMGIAASELGPAPLERVGYR